jgi:hypothetical protein
MKREFKTMDANQAVANVAYRLNEAIAISRSLHALRWASGPTHGRRQACPTFGELCLRSSRCRAKAALLERFMVHCRRERLPPRHAAALEPLGTPNHVQANGGHEETKQEGQYTALVRIVAIDPQGAPSIQARVVAYISGS